MPDIIVQKLSEEAWQLLTEKYRASNYFLSKDWLTTVAKNFKLTNHYFSLNTDAYSAHIVLQVSETGMGYAPFIGYGGIVSDHNLSYSEIEDIVTSIEQQTPYKIARMKFSPFFAIRKENSSFFAQTSAVIVPLQKTMKEQEKIINKKTRTEVRYAKKHGVVVKNLQEDELENFYSIYTETMRRVSSNYMTPRSLFHDILSLEDSIILGAYYKEKLLAGSVFFLAGEGLFYWWNASNAEGKKLSANYAILHEAIRFAINHSKKFLDMASSHTKQIEESKLKWGGRLMPFVSWER